MKITEEEDDWRRKTRDRRGNIVLRTIQWTALSQKQTKNQQNPKKQKKLAQQWQQARFPQPKNKQTTSNDEKSDDKPFSTKFFGIYAG
jgi:hypothetical protein